MFGRYLWVSVERGNTRHLLFKASAACLAIIAVELVRTALVLLGFWEPTAKQFWITLAEHIPFLIVGYEICKKWCAKMLYYL